MGRLFRLCTYVIIVLIMLSMLSSCAQKRFLVIEDDRIGEDCRATDTADTADGNKTSDTDYSDETKETEGNEPDDPDWDTLPETLEDIDGVARGESLVFELSVNKEYYIVVDYTGTANVVDIPAVHLGIIPLLLRCLMLSMRLVCRPTPLSMHSTLKRAKKSMSPVRTETATRNTPTCIRTPRLPWVKFRCLCLPMR